MKRMLNRMLRYADAIVKRGVDKLIDAIGNSPEQQSENTETPQQKSMGNDTDCAPQITDSTTNCGLTEQAITLMDEPCDMRYNVLDCTLEVQRRDQTAKGVVPVSKLVRNTMVIAPFNGAESDEVGGMWCSMRFSALAADLVAHKPYVIQPSWPFQLLYPPRAGNRRRLCRPSCRGRYPFRSVASGGRTWGRPRNVCPSRWAVRH